MKKILYLFALLLIVTACSDENDLGIVDGQVFEIQKRIVKLESQYYNTTTGAATFKTVSTFSGERIISGAEYENNELTKTSTYSYGANGLLSDFDSYNPSGILIPEESYSIIYDDQNRIATINRYYKNCEYTYNANNTISVISTNNFTQVTAESTYFLNDEGKIIRLDNPSGTYAEFTYENGRPVSAVLNMGSGLVDVRYDYDLTQETKGYSSYRMFIAMYGNPINSVLATNRPIENMFSLITVEENTTLVGYYLNQPQLQQLVSDFVYVRDEDNYITEYDLIANNDLYCRVTILYED